MIRRFALLIAALVCSSAAFAEGQGYQTVIPPNSINVSSYGASSSASDNQAALNNAISAAVSANKALYIPAAPSCYKYTAPLTIAGNLKIVGEQVEENWNNGIAVPLGTPPLTGSVLCPVSSSGVDAIDISASVPSLDVEFENVGILFQGYATFAASGDGIRYIPTANGQGLSGATWKNVKVYGHDGSHYAFNLQNPIYDTFINLYSYGGGILNLFGTSGSFNYGNLTFVQPYGEVVVGGTANGFTIAANGSQQLNLITFIRPQAITNNLAGVTPGGNAPTSSQLPWSQDANSTNVRLIAPDFETNVSSPVQFGTAAKGNDPDWAGLFTDAAALNAPSWSTNGIMYGPLTRTFTDTTGSGTVAIEAIAAFPGTTLKASNALTLTHMPTLYLGVPTAGTNVTTSRPESLYAAGNIFTAGVLSGSGGFLTGNSQINTNASTATTEIGDGTTSGLVTIGGASNTTNLASGTIQAGGTAGVTCASVSVSTMTTKNGIVTHC